MTGDTALYVKSSKTSTVEYSRPIADHSCTDGYLATKVMYSYTPEDQQCMELLKQAGIPHELIDLSSCSFQARLKARIAGLNETPTLVFQGEKIRGLQAIREVLQKKET
jgi:hypothetical protein